MKTDEREFLVAVYRRCPKIVNGKMTSGSRVRDVIDSLNMNHKRSWYLLVKWANRGWYDYGVNLDLGWLTTDGSVQALEQLGD